jgi:hypothetical protein
MLEFNHVTLFPYTHFITQFVVNCLCVMHIITWVPVWRCTQYQCYEQVCLNSVHMSEASVVCRMMMFFFEAILAAVSYKIGILLWSMTWLGANMIVWTMSGHSPGWRRADVRHVNQAILKTCEASVLLQHSHAWWKFLIHLNTFPFLFLSLLSVQFILISLPLLYFVPFTRTVLSLFTLSHLFVFSIVIPLFSQSPFY